MGNTKQLHKKIISLLLMLLICLSMPCGLTAAEEQRTVSEPVQYETSSAPLTVEQAQQMDISACISIANNIPPANHHTGVTSVALSSAEAMAIDRVLEYDRQANIGSTLYKKASAYDFSSEYYYDQLTEGEKKTYDAILAAFNDCLHSTKTYSSNCIGYVTNYAEHSKKELNHLYQIFYYSNPQIFCTYNIYGWSDDYSKIYLYVYDSCRDGRFRNRVKNAIDTATESWIGIMDSIYGDVAKETWLARKVASKVTYKFDTYDQGILGALFYGKCVCNGYAMTMNYFCNAVGIECITVVSAYHAWNRVKLDGKWYELDVTWLDRNDASNSCDYRWLNKSSETFMANDSGGLHDPDTDWEIGSYFYKDIRIPACTEDDPQDSAVKPRNVTVTPGDGSLSVKWDAVPGAVKYAVATTTDGKRFTTYTLNETGTSFTIYGLTGGRKYDVLVQAYVNREWSRYTSDDLMRGTPTGKWVDGKPRNVRVTPGSGGLSVKWDTVPGAVKYAVATTADGKRFTTYTLNETGSSYTITGLTAGRSYYVLVQANIHGKWTPYSSADLVRCSPTS